MNNQKDLFVKTLAASRDLSLLSEDKINKILDDLAMAAIKYTPEILDANQEDLDRMNPNDPKYDRLKLTEERLEGIASDLINVAKLDSPLGEIISGKTLDNGLELKKIRVPIGVIGIIYESRPNVTFDVFSLCLKTGNALVLKGGSDAYASNSCIVDVIHKVLKKNKVSTDIVSLLPAGREATKALLQAVGFVDMIIPRGSQGLIDYVREHSKVPVIETGAGIVHTYFDQSADLEKGKEIICNAKTRRVSVCNALDCLLVHQSRVSDLEAMTLPLAKKEVTIYADNQAYETLEGKYPENLLHHAEQEHFGTEFLSMKMSLKVVTDTNEALEHIAKYSSKHSEAIIAEDEKTINHFLKAVDAAAVYANASTAFTDGAQFGLGAEIGISTQKLHARGPMALEEMTSYKWIIKGQGQVRN
ncbi:glutamate-5-semialdehyde dehydrogenase [Cyclobacterium marinum]|uniref:glutamate-5-semialdehyde dehydrogenase n=1 Tax=Cyclobacterium marinum TaxID=104 RepID=UPI0011EFAFE0|nr:glutamate-5-semialdehyde dehydrogenase [Cyclobacterium marinum]MBI0400257.1 glutamate-5-semialdehyde dehydrogenase [Cyclobacterium marinum]|tara:strand:- start:28116 stop:29366 length:1251 start_codon:yes stop_codon:yes gene_type:complete